MMTAIYILMCIFSAGLGFLIGWTFQHDDTVKEIKKEEDQEKIERDLLKAQRELREYMNFISYDGTEQNKDIDG